MLICVDPTAYASAAQMFGEHLSSDIRRIADELGGELSGMSAVAGHDPAGEAWAESYDAVASVTVQAIDDLGRASANVGVLLSQAGFNHARAEAYSDVTGGMQLPPEPAQYSVGDARDFGLPTAAGGGFGDPPFGWEWVQDAAGVVWPDGDPEKLRAMGRAWSRAADSLDAGWVLVSEGMTALEGQESPELENARGVCRTIGDTLTELATQCRSIATACDELATHIDSARSELITEINLMLASIVAIELAAGAAAAITAGVGAVAMQTAVIGVAVATGTRISLILTRLLEMATLTGTPMVWKSADAVGDGLRTILALTPKAAEAAPVVGTLRALDELANKLSNSAWPMGPSPRGFAIETRLGGNLPPGFPTIDKFDSDHGIATSIKTVNLASKTYQNPARLESLVKRYVDKMAAFEGAVRPRYTVLPEDIKERVLHIGVPRNASSEQDAVFTSMVEYASRQGVELKVEVVR